MHHEYAVEVVYNNLEEQGTKAEFCWGRTNPVEDTGGSNCRKYFDIDLFDTRPG